MSYDLSSLSASEFNDLFFEAVEYGGEALNKTAAAIGDYIQLKIREQGFARKILDYHTVTEKDPMIQRDPNGEHDGLQYIVPLEPDTVAQRIDFRADPERTWIVGNRFPINFYEVSTDEFNKTEQELLAHTEPVLNIIEQNSLKDMQEQEDIHFLDHVKACAGLATLRLNQEDVGQGGLLNITTGGEVDAWFKGTPTTSPNASPINSNILLSANTHLRRETFDELAKIFASRQLQLRVVLMHEYDYSSTLTWRADEVGHATADQITKDGYRETTIGGYTIITTIKTNRRLVRPGHLYGFADKSALGKFLQLQAPKFWINAVQQMELVPPTSGDTSSVVGSMSRLRSRGHSAERPSERPVRLGPGQFQSPGPSRAAPPTRRPFRPSGNRTSGALASPARGNRLQSHYELSSRQCHTPTPCQHGLTPRGATSRTQVILRRQTPRNCPAAYAR